jgi:hypothetical protein
MNVGRGTDNGGIETLRAGAVGQSGAHPCLFEAADIRRLRARGLIFSTNLCADGPIRRFVHLSTRIDLNISANKFLQRLPGGVFNRNPSELLVEKNEDGKRHCNDDAQNTRKDRPPLADRRHNDEDRRRSRKHCEGKF